MSAVLFEHGDPVWVVVHGAPRRAVFTGYKKGRAQVKMRAGTIRTVSRDLVSFRYEKEGEDEQGTS